MYWYKIVKAVYILWLGEMANLALWWTAQRIEGTGNEHVGQYTLQVFPEPIKSFRKRIRTGVGLGGGGGGIQAN